MNYIVFCDKSEIKSYEKLFEGAADSKMLAAEPALDSDKISELIKQHNPHGIIIANTDYEISKIIEAVKSINEEHSNIRTIVIYPDIETEKAEEIRKYTSGVITRAITSDDFIYIVDNKLGAYEFEILNNKKASLPSKKRISAKEFNPKLLIAVGGAVFIAILIMLIASKSCGGAAGTDETEPTTELELTESGDETEPMLATFPTEKEMTSPTDKPTSPTKPTEKTTEKATEKPTEKKKPSSSSSSSPAQVYDPPASSQAPVSSQPTYSQPVYEPEPVPVETDPPYTPPASSEIIDDGRIYLDPTQITVQVGQTFEIYVTGLSAANGCSWDVQNAAVADFISGDTIKVTLKAKGVGMTIITATSKSSGAKAQCVVTVKK